MRRFYLLTVCTLASMSITQGVGGGTSQAAGGLSVSPITWDSIGLPGQSGAISGGPERFPLGVKVCNTGTDTISGARATLAWSSSNSYINLEGSSLRELGVLNAGQCKDAYYTIIVSRNSAAWDTARRYQVSVTADGGAAAATPTNRQIYIEKLATTSNTVQRIAGPGGCNADYTSCDPAPTNLQVGRDYIFKLYANTPQAYEQLEASLGFSGSMFQIDSVRSEYQTPAGAAIDSPYADACGWQWNPSSSKYRTCVGPVLDPFKPNGRAGGRIAVTYRVQVIGTGSGDLKPLIYNHYSGNPQYNSDFTDSKKWLRYNSRYPLEVETVGGGKITSEPVGIECGEGATNCSVGFDSGTRVSLRATPSAGQEFLGWGGACSGTSLTCQVVIDRVQKVSARFEGKGGYAVGVDIQGKGSVSSTPGGINCGTENSGTCSSQFQKDSAVILEPIAAEGYQFDQWNGDCSGSGACELKIDGDKKVTASFVPKPPPSFRVTIDPAPTGGKVVSQSNPDNPLQILCGDSCSADYLSGTQIELIAEAEPGYRFGGWKGCDQSGDNITYNKHCQFTVFGNRTVFAWFEPIPNYKVQLEIDGHGTVESDPTGISCSKNCSGDFQEGEKVALRATPDPGWKFVGWDGDCSDTACILTVQSDSKVRAVFQPLQHDLVVESKGSGRVTSDPAGIDCGDTCQAQFDHGSVILLEARPADGWRLKNWSGDCQGKDGCQVTLDQARRVSVEFEPIPEFGLTVSATGDGIITSQDGNISCPDSCGASYREGTPVTLEAQPAKEWRFVGWSGDCSGTGECRLDANQELSASAKFEKIQYNLQVKSSSGGSAISDDGSIDCGDRCARDYDSGSRISLKPQSDPGYRFVGWSGDCSGESACDVEMLSDRQVSASFEKIPRYALNLEESPGGRIEIDPEGADYQEGTLVRLRANPEPGYQFKSWQGDCDGSGECQIRMDQDKRVGARFEKIRFLLKVLRSGDGRIWRDDLSIDCGERCQGEYDGGSTIELRAQSGPGQYFVGWSGAGCSGRGNICQISMNDAKQVEARFAPLPRKQLQIAVEGQGTVHSLMSTIRCNSRCAYEYPITAQIGLKPIAFSGWRFAGWEGDCSGTGDCAINMGRDRSLIARFEPIPPPVYKLNVQITGSGQVRSLPEGILCGIVCSASYNKDTLVRLQAEEGVGSIFSGWRGACRSSGSSCVVRMDQAQDVQAVFQPAPPHRLQLHMISSGAGRVWSKPAGLDCTRTCLARFDRNSSLELFQDPKPGYRFVGWTGDCRGAGVCRPRVNRFLVVYAVYARQP